MKMVNAFIHSRLGRLLFLGTVIVTFCGLVFHSSYSQNIKNKEIIHWLHRNGLQHTGNTLLDGGISNLADCALLDEKRLRKISSLSYETKQELVKASNALYESIILDEWLKHNSLPSLEEIDNGLFYGSIRLENLIEINEDLKHSLTHGDAWLTESLDGAIYRLPTNPDTLKKFKQNLWKKYINEQQTPWTWGSMVVFSFLIGSLVAVASMTHPTMLTDPLGAPRPFFQYITGKYLVPQKCKVYFDWKEPTVVGGTVTFSVHFFQRNGRSYPISNKDRVNVEVTQGVYKVATSLELGSTDPDLANTATVNFSVRQAGEYKISVMIGNSHINGSPFLKQFVSGPPDPGKTGFIHHSSTIVCTEGMPYNLLLEPRDEFNNVCTFLPEQDPTEGYKIHVTEIGEKQPVDVEHRLEYDHVLSRLILQLKLEKDNCYNATITYRGSLLKNGNFNIIVLNSTDAALVQKNVASKSHNVWYEGRLVSNMDERQKAKKVYIYISPKQLIIKEFLLKFIPKRLYTFRLCPMTKFQFHGINNQYEKPSFTIDDGSQQKVELVTSDRSIIAATFTQFLLKNIGGSETFKDKQEFFYHEVRKFHQKRYHDKLPLKIQRDRLLESSMKACKGFTIGDWCKNFEISFLGEQGLDWGGVRREWFEVICSALFDPEYLLFTRFLDDKQALVHPNPNRPLHLKLKMYEFAGRIVGKCLYESALGGSFRQLVKARFSRSFLAQVIGLRVQYKYFEQDDPELYVSKVKYLLENDVQDMDLFFAEEEYSPTGQLLRVIDLIPEGSHISVTNENKL